MPPPPPEAVPDTQRTKIYNIQRDEMNQFLKMINTENGQRTLKAINRKITKTNE